MPDEPFSALDVLSAAALRGELLELWLSGRIPTKAFLMVTHNIEEAVLLGDRIAVMEKDPGRIVTEVRVSLPRQRSFFPGPPGRGLCYVGWETQPEALELGNAPGEPGKLQALPNISITPMTGLLEALAATPGSRQALYKLADELGVDFDHLLRTVEALELLGFVTVAKGDGALTPLGETFAEAEVLARKEIFAARLRRLPIFRWLLELLEAAEGKRLRGEVVRRALELEFPPAGAEKQFQVIINWGRYAELFAYEDSTGVLYLEPIPTPG